MILWVLWLERNDAAFNNVEWHPRKLIQRIWLGIIDDGRMEWVAPTPFDTAPNDTPRIDGGLIRPSAWGKLDSSVKLHDQSAPATHSTQLLGAITTIEDRLLC